MAELRARGRTARPVALDVTDPVSVRTAAEHIEERFGRLDVLVNNAGISGDITRQRPGEADLAVTRQVFEVNVFVGLPDRLHEEPRAPDLPYGGDRGSAGALGDDGPTGGYFDDDGPLPW